MTSEPGTVRRLVTAVLGDSAAAAALDALDLAPELGGSGAMVTRAQLAMALNVLLFADIQARVPQAARYVGECVAGGARIVFDHGALRTIDGETGALPSGFAAFARLLEPLGYRAVGHYPLPRLRMTGRAFAHNDFPAAIPQFFVSELHVSQLPPAAQAAAARVFGTSADPLGAPELALLGALGTAGESSHAVAAAGLPGLARAFGRHHREPALADYEALLAVSDEAAWIATEGNAFNHMTDRVPDVVALAESLKTRRYRLKASVEHSASGRVHQTAFLADRVTRRFGLADGTMVTRDVPGSFHEMITRDADPAGGIDLRFDAGNATGIFAVTGAGA